MMGVQRKSAMFCLLTALLVGVELRADTWPVVLVGQPAPGIAGARFRSLGRAAVNASGELAFHAGLAVGRDSSSNELARTSLAIPVSGHLAKYVGEIFPNMTLGQFEGKLEVVSTQPLVGLTLRQRETDFTSLPVIP